MKRPKLSSLLTVLLGWPAASTPAATILRGKGITDPGPDFFFDTTTYPETSPDPQAFFRPATP